MFNVARDWPRRRFRASAHMRLLSHGRGGSRARPDGPRVELDIGGVEIAAVFQSVTSCEGEECCQSQEGLHGADATRTTGQCQLVARRSSAAFSNREKF